MPQTCDLIVIGSGPAGEKSAAQAAYFDKTVVLAEREPTAWAGPTTPATAGGSIIGDMSGLLKLVFARGDLELLGVLGARREKG